MMKTTHIAWLMVATIAFGCASKNRGSQDPRAIAIGHVAGWEDMGAMLPAEQVPFFANNLTTVQDVLAAALGHSNEDVRYRAAYVIDEIGSPAVAIESDLARRIELEPSAHVRIYIYNALRSIRAERPPSIAALRARYDALAPLEPTGTSSNHEIVQEGIYLAAALFVLDGESMQRPEYEERVLKWLRPPSGGLDAAEPEEFADHRWSAVNSVEHMHGADAAIPLLEAILADPERPSWVEIHVPRALQALRLGGRDVAESPPAIRS
jgi:hypothetical protein